MNKVRSADIHKGEAFLQVILPFNVKARYTSLHNYCNITLQLFIKTDAQKMRLPKAGINDRHLIPDKGGRAVLGMVMCGRVWSCVVVCLLVMPGFFVIFNQNY